jgi:hypothetical protein
VAASVFSGRNLFVHIFFIVLFLSFSSYGENRTVEDERSIVRFDGPFRTSAMDVLKLCPGILTELAEDLGWQTDFRPEIILANSTYFRKVTESDLFTAVAIPQNNLILIDSSKINVYPFSLRTTLKHELCHLELHRHISESILPRWFDEGVCQWVSGGLAELMADGNRSVFSEAVLANRLMSVKELTREFPREGKAMILAYEESRSLVEFTEKKFGASGVRSILEKMSRGDSLEDAVQESFSISLDDLEKQWTSSLVNKPLRVSYLGENIYEILFVIAALITVYGFVLILKKKKNMDRDEDGEI